MTFMTLMTNCLQILHQAEIHDFSLSGFLQDGSPILFIVAITPVFHYLTLGESCTGRADLLLL